MMILYKLLLFQVIAYTLCSADNSIEDSQGSAESENYNERGQESQEVLPNPPKNRIGYTKPLVIEPKNCPLCKTVNWDELNEENAKNLTKALSNLSVYLNNTAQQLLQELQMDNLQSAMRRVSQLYAYIKGDAQQVDQQDEDVDKVQNEDLRKIQKQVYPKWNVDSVNEQQEGTLNATAKALHKIYKHLKDSYQRNFKPLFKKVMSKLHSFFKQKKQSIYRINPALKEFVSELIANVTDNRRKNLRSTKEQQKEIVDEDENEENSDNFDEEEKENSNASQNPLLAQLRKALSKLYNKKVNTQKKKKYNSNANLYLTDSDSDNLYEEEQKNQRLAKLKKALSRLYPINVSAEQKKKYNFNTVLREFVSELIANIADNRRQKSLKEQQKDVFRKILTETLSDLYPRPPTDDDDGWDPTDDEYDFDSYPHRKNQLQANLKKSLRRIYPIIYRQRSFTKKAKDFLKKVVVHLQETLSSLFAINIHALQKTKYKILKDLSEPIDTYPRLPTDDDYNWDNPNKPTDDDYDFDSYPNWSILDEAQERYFNGRKNQLQAKLKKSLYRLNSIKVNARLKNTALREVVSELIANIAANRRQQSLKKQQEDFFRKVLSESLSDLYSDPPDEDDYSWDYSDDLNLTDEDEDEDEDEYDDQETSDNLFEEAQENQQLTTLQRFLSRLYPNTANVQPKKKYNFNIVLREVLSDLYQNASDEDEDEDEENSDNSDEEGKDDFNTVRKQLLDELYAYIKANHQQHFDSLSREQKQNLKAVLEGVSELYVHLKYKDQQNFGTDLGLEQNSENVTEFVKHGVASLYAYLQRKYQENVDSLDEEQKEHSRALLNGVSEINALFNEGAQYAPQEESTSAGATTENRWIKIFSGGSNLTDVSSLLSQRLVILNPVINPVYVYANMGSDGERPEKIVLPETTTESENLATQTRAETENETPQSEQADGSATHTRGVTSDAALTEEQAVANSIVSQINEVRANSGSGSPNLWAIVNNQDSTAKTIFETGLVNVVNSGQTDEQASEAVRQANFDRGKLNSQVSISTNSAKPFPTYVDDSLPEYIRRQLTILGYDRRASGVNRNPKKRLLGSSNQHSIMYPEAVVDDSSVSPENKTSNASNRK